MSEPFVPKLVKMCAQAGLPPRKKVAKKATDDDKKKRKRFQAAFLKSKIWPANTTIKIGFMREPSPDIRRSDINVMEKTVDTEGNSLKIDPLQRIVTNMPVKEAIIKTVQERLQPIVNVKLTFYDENNELINPNVADIRIDFDDDGGAWSVLGTECLTITDKNEPTMNFGWFDVPTVLHEFCHALGMIHEHQNPKGKAILWDKERVHQWASETQGWSREKTDENIIERYKLDEINGSTFDGKSIMLYFFPGNLVLDPNTNQCCGTGTNQNLMFSPYDVLYLNYNYPLKNSSLTSEQFTVKYFNDVFNQQVDINDLKKQLDSTRNDEDKPSKQNAMKPSVQNALKPSVQNALKPEEVKDATSASAAAPASASAPTAPAPTSASDGSSSELCKPGCVMPGSTNSISFVGIMLFIIVLLCIIIGISVVKH